MWKKNSISKYWEKGNNCGKGNIGKNGKKNISRETKSIFVQPIICQWNNQRFEILPWKIFFSLGSTGIADIKREIHNTSFYITQHSS